MDVIVFQVYGQYCALPTDKVREIIEPLPVTPLPFTPGFVDGLINIGGRVVVQMDLGGRLGFHPPLVQTGGIVLVVDVDNGCYAVRVDQVFTRASLTEELLTEYANPVAYAASVVSGQFVWMNSMVLLLCAENMGLDDIVPQGVPDGEGGLLAVGGAVEKDRVVVEQEDAYLITTVGGEYYALALNEILEVVELDSLTRLPHAPQEVLGLMLLRGTPLLVLSLAGLLEMSEAPQGHCPYAIVVEKEGKLLGLAIERLLGIQRYSESVLQPVEESHGDITGYFIGKEKDAQQRMIGLLSIAGLINAEHSARYRGYLVDGASTETYQLKAAESKKQRLLIIRLGTELFALPLAAILRIEEDLYLTPVPAAANAALIGAVQVQGDVLPVIDIAAQLGLTYKNKAVFFVVVQLENERWALRVDFVERVIDATEAELEQISSFSEGYLSAIGRLDGRLYSILRLESMLRSAA